ncbi:MAG: hypothetical protein OXH28_12230 [bacterium]|nr:hypothetical protein [bacterium]
MNLFSRRRPTTSTPIGAVVEGDAAIFAWRADLRARLDAQIACATDVALAAAKSWATLDDPPPRDTHLAEALRDAGLWGSEHEPGTHIARWSEDNATVTLRAWDWDLTRPLDGDDYPRMARTRTLPWMRESGRGSREAAENDPRIFELHSVPAPPAVEPPERSARDTKETSGGLRENHDSILSQGQRRFARLFQENRAFQSLVVVLITVVTAFLFFVVFDLNSLSGGLPSILTAIVLYPIFHWMDRRGWFPRRPRTD